MTTWTTSSQYESNVPDVDEKKRQDKGVARRRNDDIVTLLMENGYRGDVEDEKDTKGCRFNPTFNTTGWSLLQKSRDQTRDKARDRPCCRVAIVGPEGADW